LLTIIKMALQTSLSRSP